MASLFQSCVAIGPPGHVSLPGPPQRAPVLLFHATPSRQSKSATPFIKTPLFPPLVSVAVPVFSVGVKGN